MHFPRIADYPYVVVRVACRSCPRRGCYRLARLAERYGAECTLIKLIDDLSASCERRVRARTDSFASVYATCQAHLPDLSSGEAADVPAA